jgi:hypothetical protein
MRPRVSAHALQRSSAAASRQVVEQADEAGDEEAAADCRGERLHDADGGEEGEHDPRVTRARERRVEIRRSRAKILSSDDRHDPSRAVRA